MNPWPTRNPDRIIPAAVIACKPVSANPPIPVVAPLFSGFMRKVPLYVNSMYFGKRVLPIVPPPINPVKRFAGPALPIVAYAPKCPCALKSVAPLGAVIFGSNSGQSVSSGVVPSPPKYTSAPKPKEKGKSTLGLAKTNMPPVELDMVSSKTRALSVRCIVPPTVIWEGAAVRIAFQILSTALCLLVFGSKLSVPFAVARKPLVAPKLG